MRELDKHRYAAVLQTQLDCRRAGAAQLLQGLLKRRIEQFLEAAVKSTRLLVQLVAGCRSCRKKFAVGRERDLNIEGTPEIALLRMNVEYQVTAEAVLEHLPFDDPHRHLHQRKRVALVISVVA